MRDFFHRHRLSLFFLALILGALLLYSNALRQKQHTSLFESLVLSLTAPLLEGTDQLRYRLHQLWSDYLHLVAVQKHNQHLQQQLGEARRQLALREEMAQENIRLLALLNLRQGFNQSSLAARVIAADAASWFRTLTIDRGLTDGLHEGAAVIAPAGVVGRIIKCTDHSARVLLLTDASSAAAALVQNSRTRGVVRGQGSYLSFDYADRLHPIQIGDQVVTAGTGGIFPKGLPIGSVSRVQQENYGLFQTVEVRPAVDFSRLEEVLVLLPEAP